ncbi:MAG: tRNA (N6-isopentenyl adenosine(37)-C2)-methylthiotransferase MiaB [Ruminococcaceae bacterium]|nr:tRNA (N6-isopentenyl adenosine(37)-C2)-methylthiotransferase MiaB [Oscillospiraceae bacterium]
MKEIDNAELEKQRDFIQKIRLENHTCNKQPLAFVETYGCAQNENDSERLCGMLSDMGYGFCGTPEKADLVLYNTCAVRENAELRVFGNLGALKHLKRKKPSLLIGVCGCMIQQEHIAEQIKKKYKHVDMIFGTHVVYRFPQLLDEARSENRVIDIEDSEGVIFEGVTSKRDNPPLAKIPIMYGCNNFCTYCIVPYVRGRERSRSAENILNEVREVAALGYREVMLLGQNVNSYGKDLENPLTFATLLREVCKVDGIERIRFMTSHPKDISDELIDAMASEDKICKQLHLPVQCGSDRILKKMNRSYTREKYLDIVRKVREKMPDIVLTSDVIVGFPGETNEDFEETMSILAEVRYDMIFSFIYSKRKGTPAAEMEDCLTDEEKHRNFERMVAFQNEISKEKNDAYFGKCEKVLVEGPSKTNLEFMCGRTDGGKIVNFRGTTELAGQLVDVKITEVKTWSLIGEII